MRAGRQWEVRSQEGAHPRAAVAPQSGSCAVIAIEEFHVVIATVGLLFHLEGLEHQLHTVAFLGHDDPLAVHPSGVVVIAKLGVGIKVFGLHICPHLAPTLCRGGMTRLTVTDEKTIFTEPPRTFRYRCHVASERRHLAEPQANALLCHLRIETEGGG